MMEWDPKKLLNGGLSDCRLKSLGWSDDGNDLLVSIVAAGGSMTPLCLRFVWTTKLRIDMDFGDYSGLPLIYGSEVVPSHTDGDYRVRLFLGAAPEGDIAFTCNDIKRSAPE